MHDDPHSHPPIESELPLVPSGAWLAHGLSRIAATRSDRESLERTLLEWLVHPDGGRMKEAVLLVWNDRDERFHGWLRLVQRHGTSLHEVFEGAGRSGDVEAHETNVRFRRFQPSWSEIGPAEKEAWESAAPVTGPSKFTGDPWAADTQATAMRISVGGSPSALVIVRHAPEERAASTLAHAASLFEDTVAISGRVAAAARHERRLAVLAEMAQSCVSAMNVAEALHLAARLAVKATGARGSAVWRRLDDIARLEITHGSAGQRERLARGLTTLMEDAVATQSVRVLDRTAGDERIPEDVIPHVPSVVMQPVVAYGRALGAIAVYDRTCMHPSEDGVFEAEDIRFLAVLADQLALVLDHAARYDAVRAMQQQNEDLRTWMRREERLASLGEVAARGAREVRNPLASIAAFARRAHREMGQDDPQREYLEIVINEADRLERIMDEQLEWATQPAPRLDPHNVNELVQAALQKAGEKIVRRRVRLLKNLAPDLPKLLLDPDRMRLVLTNVVGHALDAVSVGGRVRVTSRRSSGHVVIDVAHDGLHDGGALMDQLFVPFSASREGAASVSFGVANQVVREHGGEIRVRSDAEWSQVLSLSLPVRGNEERRAAAADRRTHRGDRRNRFPAV